MLLLQATDQGTTTLRTAGDYEADKQAAIANSKAKKFEEWPNEAGFDGLSEQRGPFELPVGGSIPTYAIGSLYRTGPGGCKVEGTKSGTFHISHWFDGLAHTHRFDIVADPSDPAKTRVLYSSRRQSDDLIRDIQSSSKFRAVSFGQLRDPCTGLFGKFMSVFDRGGRLDNIAVTVQANIPGLQECAKKNATSNGTNGVQGHRAIPGTVFLGTDTAWLSQIDPKGMQPLGFFHHRKLHTTLKGPMGPAHAMVDPATGDYFSFNLDFSLAFHGIYRIFKVNAATGKTTILATVKQAAAYIHSFFLTPSYVVLCIPVSHLDVVKLLWRGNLVEAFKPFDSSKNCKWLVVDRNGAGLVGELDSPAAFFFHSTNAFEEPNGDVVCEYIEYSNTDVISSFYYDVLLHRNNWNQGVWGDRLASGQKYPHLVRRRLRKADFLGPNSNAGGTLVAALDLDILGPHAGDLPTINNLYIFRRNRYVFCLLNQGLSTLFDSIAKINTETKEVLYWSGGFGHSPGEAIFVARPPLEGKDGEPEEDDGVLLSVVLDGIRGTSYLVCLDAKTMTETGRAECQFAVGFGFHGLHLKG
ncbi:hypothetical protein DV736_g6645, partial [Chaetothyriales sp. CBS 134916]